MTQSAKPSRRQFLKSSLGAAGAVLAPQIVRAETLGNANKVGANSRIGMGFIGMGLISDSHLRSFSGMKHIQPVAVCDVKDWQLKQAADLLKERGHEGFLATSRFEELLAHPNVDAACVTTPDHWQAAMALAAIKAGKDVYLKNR